MLDDLKDNNRAWASRMVAGDADFFRRLSAGQAPECLWIGCADSRVPASQVVGLGPGGLFVHRNIANLASPDDASYLSVLQYAVDVLKVKHVLVVGHYGCGGVAAAAAGDGSSVLDRWLDPIRELCDHHRDELDSIPDRDARLARLCELNVAQQVRNIASGAIVRDAWARGQDLRIHGWVYSLADGLVKDLGVSIGRPEGSAEAG